ncbi:hypothetical protein QJS66_00600 [Kocuria rhizophila]|nr:hypothetical protein QJS66_00600 [Kocuria rhizophila]
MDVYVLAQGEGDGAPVVRDHPRTPRVPGRATCGSGSVATRPSRTWRRPVTSPWTRAGKGS